MDVLRPVVRPYAWGSSYAIAELQGRPAPTPGPEAELWMGAHPGAPAALERDGGPTTLDAVIAADPAAELGPECVARFGPRLPFLLKVLAADKALSIQVHPSRAQAQAGFRAENEAGLPAGDPARNYTDDWPKPELLYALTPFEVLAGLRPVADAAALLRALAVDQLAPLAAQLEASQAGPPALMQAGFLRAGVRADVFASVLRWPADGRAALVQDVVAACARLAATRPTNASYAGASYAGASYAGACAAAVQIAADHPGDLGVVASLLMRHAVLAPGQAVFMPAGGLHAYLRGTGIELLANSDNVVRAGLTGKHLDVPELLKLLDPSVAVPVLAAHVLPDGISWFDSPAPEFRLYLVDLTDRTEHTVTLPGRGPRIALCTEGTAVLHTRGDIVELRRGESAFISAADLDVRGSGRARLFLAAPGPERPDQERL
jgi:mannose-6-phosphate isomerase